MKKYVVLLLMLRCFSAYGQASLTQLIDDVNTGISLLLQKSNGSNGYPPGFQTNINNVSDYFYTYCQRIVNAQSVLSQEDEELLKQDISNYDQLIKACLKPEQGNKDSMLVFIKNDLVVKIASGYHLQSNQQLRKVCVHVKVMDKSNTTELPGYDVFIEPFMCIGTDKIIQLNPTKNAVTDVFPGIKRVKVYYHNQLIDQRKVEAMLKAEEKEKIVIFNVL